MPFAGVRFRTRRFCRDRTPGFANFAAEVMVFFGAFRAERTGSAFTYSRSPPSSRLWGVVISAVYMLRAYRAIFMGATSPSNGVDDCPIIPARLRLPIILLVAATLVVGFFPQYFLRSAAADLFAVHCRDRSMIPAPALEIAVLVFGTDSS